MEEKKLEKNLTFEEQLEVFFETVGVEEIPERWADKLNLLEIIKMNAQSNLILLDQAHNKKEEKMTKGDIDKYLSEVHQNEIIYYNAKNYYIPRVRSKVKKEKEAEKQEKRLENRRKIKSLLFNK